MGMFYVGNLRVTEMISFCSVAFVAGNLVESCCSTQKERRKNTFITNNSRSSSNGAVNFILLCAYLRWLHIDGNLLFIYRDERQLFPIHRSFLRNDFA